MTQRKEESTARHVTAGSDYVGGNKYAAGNIDTSAVALGENARATLNYYTQIIVRADSIEDLPPAPGEPPYKGLAYFTEKDKDIYFGREALSDQLVGRLQRAHFLALIGASGSGKSSLLRAGIIPRLRERNWRIRVMKPGAQPLMALAATLTPDAELPAVKALKQALADDPDTLSLAAAQLVAQAGADRLLLAVDQFEELFTQSADPAERQAFVDSLVRAAQARGAVTVLVSMRADFYGRVSDFPELTGLVAQHQVYVKPLAQEDLIRVIAEPAKRGNWLFVEGLLEQFVEDVGREPGRLPLLSHALRETWERRRGNIMTLGGYRATGGVEGAIAQTAEDTLKQLIAQRSDYGDIARRIFLELTELGDGSEDTRRVASLEQLTVGGDDEELTAVLEILVQARLVKTTRGDVEVAHEALIRRWPTLREWLAENREQLRFERQLARDAKSWDEDHGRDESFLYRGARLAQAIALVEDGSITATGVAETFLAYGRELATREEREREARRQRELAQARAIAEQQEELRHQAERVSRRTRAILAIVSLIALGFFFSTVVIPIFMQWTASDTTLVELPMNDGSTVLFEAYEVTNDRYDKCVRWGDCYQPNGYRVLRDQPDVWREARHWPVVGIDVRDAMVFCDWVGRTLPTAEQWDTAVVPVSHWSTMESEQALLCRSEPCELEPVGQRTISQNPEGLPVYDLVGSVSEWTRTAFDSPDGTCEDIVKEPVEPRRMILLGPNYRTPPQVADAYTFVSDQSTFGNTKLDTIGFRCVQLASQLAAKEYACPSLRD